MIIFGIESSCDETSVCLLKDGKQDEKEILSLKTHSQIAIHKQYGGVVPELAARSHIEVIKEITQLCFSEANILPQDIDKICVTSSPGLISGLLVGIEFAKGMGLALNKPVLFVNHLEGHIFTTAITDGIKEDFFCLLVSGGHTQTICVKNINDYKIIGKTIDDSCGEAFDKISKSLGFGYPGGPIIEKMAQQGNPDKFKFSGKFYKQNQFDFSFSGLKTHFIRLIEKIDTQNIQEVQDLCASFQKVVCDILCSRVENIFLTNEKQFNKFVLCGGVGANKEIRNRLTEICKRYEINLFVAPLSLCTDNAAMIANLGFLKS